MYKNKLEKLVSEAQKSVASAIKDKGVISQHHSGKVLKVTDPEMQFTLQPGRWLTEINSEHLYDQNGFAYFWETLQYDLLFTVIDSLIGAEKK